MPRSLLVLGLAASATAAHADTVTTHALVVGSNAAGPGQTELRYAESDARRVGALLTELGGYEPATVDIVTRPTPAILRERITRLEQRVAADVTAGKQVRVFFYYSGHARASAIDLGPEQLPLAELRSRLFAVPATLKVVVLDACQSGAFSRVKGATPAADFSINSKQQLDASGIAVLASSTGSELSQESEQLAGSYFTHHLLVGMRGAGDANSDGQVTVDEAYRYAYHQTLLATAATAVGGQHVTLEVDLKGHGEVPLSFPRSAAATIELPASLEGHTFVHAKRARAMVAETHKARGAAVRIAVAPGEYEVLVRQGDRLRRCPLVAPGAVDLARCSSEAYVEATRKGARVPFRPSYRIELGFVVGSERDDAYLQTMRDFGFVGGEAGYAGWQLGASRELWRGEQTRLFAGLGVARTGNGEVWTRETERFPLEFSWDTTTVSGTARIERVVPGMRRFIVYADTNVGVGIGRTRFVDQDDVAAEETHYGVTAGVGLGFGGRRVILDTLDFMVGARVWTAPVIDNEVGDTHDSGGFQFGMSTAVRFGGDR